MQLLKMIRTHLIAAVAVAAVSVASAAPLCVADTFAAYKLLGAGGCQVGDLLFFNFDNTTSTATRHTQTPAAAPDPVTDIVVTPTLSGTSGVSETITLSMAIANAIAYQNFQQTLNYTYS